MTLILALVLVLVVLIIIDLYRKSLRLKQVEILRNIEQNNAQELITQAKSFRVCG